MSGHESHAEERIASYSLLLFENYCTLASIVLLWFDFALMFPTEVRNIWGRKFSGAKLVYLVVRYTALAIASLAVTRMLLWNSSDQMCGRIFRASGIMHTVQFLAFSAFSILGVYGIWSPDWKPLLVVAPLALTKPVVFIYEMSYCSTPIQGGAPRGCLNICSGSEEVRHILSLMEKTTPIASYAVVVGLTWFKTFSIHRVMSEVGMRTALTTLLLHDGTVFFMILLLNRIVVIVSETLDSPPLFLMAWPSFEKTLGPILFSRFLLKVCGLHFSDRKSHMNIPFVVSSRTISPSSFDASSIRFNVSRILGNLSTTLSHLTPPEDSPLSRRNPGDGHPNDQDIEEVERGPSRPENDDTVATLGWEEPGNIPQPEASGLAMPHTPGA